MIVMIYNWPFYPNVFLLLQVVGKRVSHHYYHCQNCHQTYCLGGSEWKTKMFGNAPAHLWIFPPVPIIAKPAYWSGTHKVWQNFSKTWIVLPHVYYTLKVRHYIFWLKKNIFKKSSIFLLLKSHICHPHKSVNRTTSRQFLSQSWYKFKELVDHHQDWTIPVCLEGAPCRAPRSDACTGRQDQAGPVSTLRTKFNYILSKKFSFFHILNLIISNWVKRNLVLISSSRRRICRDKTMLLVVKSDAWKQKRWW